MKILLMPQRPVMEMPIPVSVRYTNNGTSEVINEFELTIEGIGALTKELDRDIFIKLPEQVPSNALDSFKTELHEAIPTLKNMTEERLERLISDHDSDDSDE